MVKLLTDDGVVDLCVDADVLIDGRHLSDPDSDRDLLRHLHRQGHRVLDQTKWRYLKAKWSPNVKVTVQANYPDPNSVFRFKLFVLIRRGTLR